MEYREFSIPSAELDKLFNYGRDAHVNNIQTSQPEILSCLKDGSIIIENFSLREPNQNFFSTEVRNHRTNIIVRNCVFKSGLRIGGSGRNQNITFDNVIFEDDFTLKVPCENIEIKNCSIPYKLDCESDARNSISITVCKFKFLNIRSVSQGRLSITDTVISEEFKFSGNVRKEVIIQEITCLKIDLSNLVSDQTFRLLNLQNINELNFSNAVFNNRLIISNSAIKGFSLNRAIFKKELLIESSNFTDPININFGNTPLRVSISEGTRIGALYIDGTINFESFLIIADSSLKLLSFENFKNFGTLKLSDLHIDKAGSLIIKYSNLGKAEIYNSNFSNLNFEFAKSQINEIFISETDFPESVHEGNARNYGQGKLAFGQLQTVFQKQGDSVRSYEYLAREIKSYYKQLSFLSSNFFTKVNLFLNSISNNFGRNWVQGFLFSFGIALFFFYLLVVSTKEFSFGLPISFQWDFTEPFLRFMNPLRHFDAEVIFQNTKYSRLSLTHWSYIIDFLGRIFIAYGYYQTIQAFRKFGRR
ncbi:MAG: hypothetical protein ACTHML_06005 [Ginsengibacter sp.]